MTWFQRIRYAREQRNLTQDELARKLGYKDRSTIAKIETGKADLPQKQIYKFAEALDVPVEYLYGFEERPWEDDIAEDYENARNMKEKIDIVRDNGIDPRYAYKYYLEKHDYDLIPHEKESSQPAFIESEVDRELLSLFSRLTKDQQQQVLDYLRFLLSKS